MRGKLHRTHAEAMHLPTEPPPFIVALETIDASTDPRVVLHERTNARRLDRSIVADPIDVAAVDVSFISARLILPAVAPLLSAGARVVVLVKPQFEARRGEVPSGGIVEDAAVRARVVEEVSEAAAELGLERRGVIESPIRGARGNVEFLLALAKR